MYVWADGVYFGVRLEQERLAALVLIGARADGTKEVIALEDGYRESKESWLELLRDLRRRGMSAPNLAVGDGALGFWAALGEVYPQTREQRCWVHKLANVLDKLPKSLQPRAKAKLHEAMNAPTKKECEAALDGFVRDYSAKYPKACASLHNDRDRLLTLYDFPAEHWKHLRQHQSHRVHLRHGQAPTESHQGSGKPSGGTSDGLRADATGAEELEETGRAAPADAAESRNCFCGWSGHPEHDRATHRPNRVTPTKTATLADQEPGRRLMAPLSTTLDHISRSR